MVQASQHIFPNRLSESEFGLIRDYFYKRSGIYFDDSKRYFVDKRVLSRIKETGHNSFRAYFSFLRLQSQGEELQHLVNLMTVNETYFYREEYQLQSMVTEVLEEIINHKKNGDLIRIWSLPCSTGEEAYSIAIYLMENWPLIEKIDVEIVGSDIDSRVLHQAKQGNFSQRSVKNLPPNLKRKYFDYQAGSDSFQIKKSLQECVHFCPANISEDESMNRFSRFDLVFCRNLLIYFDDISRRQAAERMYDSMNPGGILLLGHSESMSRVSSLFKVKRFTHTTAYQKAMK